MREFKFHTLDDINLGLILGVLPLVSYPSHSGFLAVLSKWLVVLNNSYCP